jgi:hypothetical protein
VSDRADLKVQKPVVRSIEAKVKTDISFGDVLVLELKQPKWQLSTQPTDSKRVIAIIRPQLVTTKEDADHL